MEHPSLCLLWASLQLHNKLPQASRCVPAFNSSANNLYLRPSIILLSLTNEHILIEIVTVIENQYLQNVHAFNIYHSVVILMLSQHLSNKCFYISTLLVYDSNTRI